MNEYMASDLATKGDPTAKYVIGGFWILIILAVIGFSTGILYIKEDPIQTTSAFDKMCLRDIIPANGGTLAEPTGGSYSYTLIARANGTVEVWEECDASAGTQ